MQLWWTFQYLNQGFVTFKATRCCEGSSSISHGPLGPHAVWTSNCCTSIPPHLTAPHHTTLALQPLASPDTASCTTPPLGQKHKAEVRERRRNPSPLTGTSARAIGRAAAARQEFRAPTPHVLYTAQRPPVSGFGLEPGSQAWQAPSAHPRSSEWLAEIGNVGNRVLSDLWVLCYSLWLAPNLCFCLDLLASWLSLLVTLISIYFSGALHLACFWTPLSHPVCPLDSNRPTWPKSVPWFLSTAALDQAAPTLMWHQLDSSNLHLGSICPQSKRDIVS